MISNPKWTTNRGEWRVETVSDAIRIVVGTGRSKVILARFAPPQLPEAETHANARLASAAVEMTEALEEVYAYIGDGPCIGSPTLKRLQEVILYALAKARGEL